MGKPERENKLRAFAFNGEEPSLPPKFESNLEEAIATHLKPQKPKAKCKFAVDIDTELRQAFKEECTQMGVQMNEAMEFLLKEFLKARGRKV